MNCQASFKLNDQTINCSNAATQESKLNFGSWQVIVELCDAHTELWNMIEESPMIVKRIGRS